MVLRHISPPDGHYRILQHVAATVIGHPICQEELYNPG